MDYPEREVFLQRLEENLNASDRRSASSLSPMLPLISTSETSHPSDPISDNTPPQWQPLQIPHQISRAVEDSQDNRFMADDTSTDAVDTEDGAFYSTPNSYFIPGTNYDSGYTDGSI
jgi:hypothetical protein